MIHELSLKNKNQSRLEETGLLGENGETLKGVVQVILQLQELMKQYDTEDGAANKHIGILIRKDLDRDHIVETVGRMSSKGEIIDFLANRQICPNDHLATKIIDFYNDL